MSRIARGAPWLLATVLIASSALADPALAEVLFHEGRQLMQDGKIDEACPKLEESQKLDPSSGTLINLAACHEAQGKIATAWGEFVAAARMARATGKPERAEEATDRAEKLRPRVPHVRVIAPPDAPGAVLFRDGQELGSAVFGTEIPTDPGQRVFEVRAPDREAWSTTLEVAESSRQELPVPELAKLTPEPLPPPPPAPAPVPVPVRLTPKPAQPPPSEAQLYAGWTMIIGGGVVAGVGALFGGLALAANGDSVDACPARTACSDESIADYDRANGYAWAANVLIPLGVVSGGVGIILLLTQPDETADRTTLTVAPVLGAANGAVVGLSF